MTDRNHPGEEFRRTSGTSSVEKRHYFGFMPSMYCDPSQLELFGRYNIDMLIAGNESIHEFISEYVAAFEAPLCSMQFPPLLSSDDMRLRDYAEANLDIQKIQSWANCPDDPRLRRYRQQFLTTCPILVPAVVLHPLDASFNSLSAAVDRGDPVEVMADVLKVERTVLRFICGLSLATIGSRWIRYEHQLFRALELLPVDKYPRSPRDWFLMHEFYLLLGVQDYPTEKLFRDLCVGGYERASHKLGDLERLLDVRSHIALLMRWIRVVAELKAGRCMDLDTVLEIFRQFIGSVNTFKLVAQEVRSCKQQWRVQFAEQLSPEAERLASWRPLLPIPFRARGVDAWIESICTYKQLVEEANELEHCVGEPAFHVACVTGERVLSGFVAVNIAPQPRYGSRKSKMAWFLPSWFNTMPCGIPNRIRTARRRLSR